jgi:hypothetical protein
MKMPSHSTLVAYLALFVALGGSAYAVSKIDSGDIANRSIKGKDVANDALGGRQIDERKLNAPPGAGRQLAQTCDPTPASSSDCVTQGIHLDRPSSLVIVATAGRVGGEGVCAIAVDGAESDSRFVGSTMGPESLAMTQTTSRLSAGAHTVALRCTESGADLTLGEPTIAAVAVTTDNH